MSRVTEAYPFDGPHTPDTVKAAASDLAELVRYLCNATRRGDSLPQPSDLAVVVGSLQQAFGGLLQPARQPAGLPQLLDQIAAHAARFGTWSDLYDTGGDNPAVVAGSVNLHLRAAAATGEICATEIAAAHQAVSRLGIDERKP